MFGLLNIDKPAGITSRTVVNRVAYLAGKVKVGHAGTLDPLATGVLVLGLGPATRLVEYVQRGSKKYVGMFDLGRTSNTEDITGEVETLVNPPQPSRKEIEDAIPAFIGRIEQRPPDFSAVKIAGQRAYAVARKGGQVDLKPRTITIESLRIVEYTYPQLQLEIVCGSGTYIRAVGRDLAESLGTGAVMTKLRRMAIGPFCIKDSCSLDDLTEGKMASHLMDPVKAIEGIPTMVVKGEDARRLSHGMSIVHSLHSPPPETAALDSSGRLLAILVPREQNTLSPAKNFVPAES